MRGVVAVTALLFAVMAQPAAATFPGDNGRIAMEQFQTGSSTIGTVNADGTGERTGVVAVGPEDLDPAWAPDGRHLAFASTRDGNYEIYVLDTDTGSQTRLTFDPAPDRDPAWSPDGTQIAFSSARNGNSEIYVMPAAGGAPRRLTTDPGIDQQPTWSSTGLIAFASDRAGTFDLYVMDAQGGGQRPLTQSPATEVDPSWSPDGSRLAYAAGNGFVFDIYAIDANGQNAQLLARDGQFASWSPDGTRIAFVRPPHGTQVYVMSAAGDAMQPAELVGRGTDPNWAPLPPPVGPPDQGRTLTIAAAAGTVLVAPATTQAPETTPVLEAQVRSPAELPVGTTIDATHGTLAIDAITTTPDGPGTVGHADVTGGIFTMTQASAAGAEPTFRLVPGVRSCAPATTSRLPPRDPEARMHLRARGRFRSVSGYGSGAGRGTDWRMHDRCDGTTFKVYEGLVLVRDFGRHVTVRVRAGQCYLAARQRRRDALKPRARCPRVRPPR